jgi:hypothetical protein
MIDHLRNELNDINPTWFIMMMSLGTHLLATVHHDDVASLWHQSKYCFDVSL